MISSLLPPHSRIAIYPDHLQDGLGDFATAAQIAHLLFTREQLHRDQILLLSTQPEKFAGFNHHGLECRKLSTLTSDEKASIALYIIAPVGIAIAPSFFQDKKPVLVVTEYNDSLPRLDRCVTWMRGVSLGLGSKAHGLPLDPALLNWRPRSYHERLSPLKALPAPLQQAILFPTPAEIPYFLHVGYAKSPLLQLSFVESLSRFHRQHQEAGRLVVVLPNFHLPSLPLLPPSVEVVEYDAQQKSVSVIQEGEEGPFTIRIVRGILSHDLFLTLLKASRREVIATGDASLTEMLSLGKRLSYEELPHKRTFALELEEASFAAGEPAHIFYPQTDFDRDSVERQAASLLRHWKAPVSLDPAAWLSRCDAWPLIQHQLAALLHPQEIPAPLEVAHPAELPFDTPSFLTLKAVLGMQIDAETGESSLAPGSIFDYAFLSEGLYRIVRKRKEAPPPRREEAPRQTPCAAFCTAFGAMVRRCFARLFLSSRTSKPHFS